MLNKELSKVEKLISQIIMLLLLSENFPKVMEEKSFPCITSCGKSFTALRSLQEHVKTIHEGLRNYECNYCGKDFTKSGNLKAHISAVHDGEKNYHCSQCSKSFSQLSNYNLHYR